jgi:hypothetical protein
MPEYSPYEGLSTEEIRVMQNLSKWSSAKVGQMLVGACGLVDKVRVKLEAYVDKYQDDADFIPEMGWTMAYRCTVDGAARLASEYYKREAKNPAMGLTDEQLEIELQKAALALVDSLPLEDVERIVRRRKYVEAHGEEAKPPGQRAGRPPKRLMEVVEEET